jgi:hypothetical protein
MGVLLETSSICSRSHMYNLYLSVTLTLEGSRRPEIQMFRICSFGSDMVAAAAVSFLQLLLRFVFDRKQ